MGPPSYKTSDGQGDAGLFAPVTIRAFPIFDAFYLEKIMSTSVCPVAIKQNFYLFSADGTHSFNSLFD